MVRVFEEYDSGLENELEPTLEDLLVRMGDSDESAFEMFYHRIRPYGMKVILDVVQDFGKAEEVYNDAMLKLYRYSSAFDESNGAALPLFKVIAKRTAIDRIRGRRIVCFAADPLELRNGQPMWETCRSPDAEALLASDIQNLEDSIGRLSPALKRPIKMSFETGMSYSEIARELKLPLGSVKTSMRRGIIALRDLGMRRTSAT